MGLVETSAQTLVGLAVAVAFALLCFRNMPRAILLFSATAWFPFIQVVSFAGSTITQGLLIVELLTTVLIVAWWLSRSRYPNATRLRVSFERPLLFLLPLSVASLIAGLLGQDSAVPGEHVKLSVSMGQILLILWPVGLYFVVSRSIDATRSIRSLTGLLIALAVPSIGLLFVPPRLSPYLAWSLYFALFASPFCFSASFETRSPFRKLGLWIVGILPLVYGFQIGKVFLYATVATGLVTVLGLRARKTLLALIPLTIGLYLLWAQVSGSFVPAPFQGLVDVEQQQQSWGGRTGRVAVGLDAIDVWRRYPLLGVGPGNSWPYMNRYSVIDTPHNQYLNILLEFGLIGLICFLWFIGGALRTGLALVRQSREPFHRTFIIGWTGAFAGLLVGGLTGDYIIHSVRNGGLELFSAYYLQWVILGMVVSTIDIERRDEEDEEEDVAKSDGRS